MSPTQTDRTSEQTEDFPAKLRQMDAHNTPAHANELMEEVANELERLRALIPAGDYVLTDDMEEMRSPKYGHGLFCTEDSIQSVT